MTSAAGGRAGARTLLKPSPDAQGHTRHRAMNRRTACAVLMTTWSLAVQGCSGGGQERLTELQRARSGDLEIVLLARGDSLTHGRDKAVLEFRTGADRHLVDVGAVKASASMPMAGMAPMVGTVTISPSETGRYQLETETGMAGTWRLAVEWDGPMGHGNVTLSSTVR